MKTIVSLILSFVLCLQTFAQTNNVCSPPPPQGNGAPTEAAAAAAATGLILVLGITVVATVAIYSVWRVSCMVPNERVSATLVLEKSYDHATWYPVRTNIAVSLQGTRPLEFYRDLNALEDSTAFYRVKIVKSGPNGS